MSGLTVFYFVIAIACSVLNVILFFKIWNMTNNVEKLKSKFVDDYYNTKQIVVEGNFDFLAKQTIKNLSKRMFEASNIYYDVATRKYNYQEAIDEAKKVLEKMDRLSMLPPHFENAEAFYEYYEKYKDLF